MITRAQGLNWNDSGGVGGVARASHRAWKA
jgi:hypothetical protein